jgi:alpha-amylase
VLSNGDGGGGKWMNVGHPNCIYLDITEHVPEPTITNDDGWAEFCCNGGSVSVWVQQSS